MLAVQQAPRMGSSQPPPDPYLPFGYAVDTDQEPLFDAPEPAPGAPLLSENDNKFLSSFFENMTANQYNMPSFGEGLNFSDAWLNLPPQFMGTTTSFGQQTGASMPPANTQGMPEGLPTDDQLDYSRMFSGPHSMPPPPPPPPPAAQASSSAPQHQVHLPHHSDDVLTAAATLLHNNAAARVAGPGNTAFGIPRRPIGPPVGHLRHQPLEEFKEENRRGMMAHGHDNSSYNDWIWGPPESRSSARHPALTGLQWGSDANFSSAQGYTSEQNKESAESMQQEQLKVLECLVSRSAATTRPSSPINAQASSSTKEGVPWASSAAQKRDDYDSPPRKRRKSRGIKEDPAEDEGDVGGANLTKASRRRKPKMERGSSPSPVRADSASSGKRRKSAISSAKPTRENLSEEQKRENHIRSEQKRRTLIKEGFDDLCDLVPGLKGGGFSKSTMLTMAAEWLEELLKGNEDLTEQLTTLVGQ